MPPIPPAVRAAHEAAIARAIRSLDLPTKVSILAGQDFWSLPAVPAIGLESLRMSDGPIGVRGTGWTPDDPSIALPSPTALAATWDPALARRAGQLLGQEARRKGVHVLLAPTVNLHRSPLGGRHFECYSEDPLLTGEIGAGYVTGVQEHSVAVTVKHFVANDSETDRMTVDVRVGERALREVYLAPFERIVAGPAGAGAWGVMAAYNRVNGTTMTEHRRLQRDILKDEWGFDGVIVSDWTAARATGPTVEGGLDIAMPSFGNPWGDTLVEAVRSGAIAEELVDDQVRRVLRLAARTGALSDVPPAVAEPDRPAPTDGATFARELAARSFVLVRNDGVLPIEVLSTEVAPTDVGPREPAPDGRVGHRPVRRIAMIGPAAQDARVFGGGSAQVFPDHVVSPLAGLHAALPADVALTYAVGPDLKRYLRPAGGTQWHGGLTAVFTARDGEVLATEPLRDGSARWTGELPGDIDPSDVGTITVRGVLTPALDGRHTFALRGVGHLTLAIGGTQVVHETPLPEPGDLSAIFLAEPEQRVPVTLSTGCAVEVALTYQAPATGFDGFVAFTLGHAEPGPGADELIDQAVAAARAADVAIVVVATTEEVESEGFDRTSLALPGRQDELVTRIVAANSRTVVVVNAGAPVLMPWAEQVAAVLLTWFPGQEAGAALADVLLGASEPGGRLPTTWPRREEDCPVRTVRPTDGRLDYDEGVFIGYRAWQRTGVQPLFPFGHGLGYTTWSYDRITLTRSGPDRLGTAAVTVTNTGDRVGREVVQVYLAPQPDVLDDDRPARWLAGFALAQAGPGERITVEVPLPFRAVQSWSDGWQTRPGRYAVEAGSSVANRPLATIIEI